MRNIIITGGELFNKGAQAMTFIAVDEMKKRFPDHRILVLSEMDLQRPKEEREQYAFEFMGWYPLKFAKCQTNPILRALCLLRNRRELLEAEEIYKNTDFMIDISGYALGSDWSEKTCDHYLDHLNFAKAFHISAYLMPQSFGPFDFQGEGGKRIDRRIARLLPTARVICAREQEGYQALKERYRLDNVIRADDLVVSSRSVNWDNIYCEIPKQQLPCIADGSVAVIPNQRNYVVAEEVRTKKLYIFMIRELRQSGLKVYILSHSDSDRDVCKQLKAEFCDDEGVILIERELNCLEFNETVRQFRFIVASRFHAIVHAFRNEIPCIALGWAVKYHDLMKQFGQERYMLDVRQNICEKDLSETIRFMMEQRDREACIIQKKLDELQNRNIFEIVGL